MKIDGRKINEKELERALLAWGRWYSERLDRIIDGSKEDYFMVEQDVFEAIGCVGAIKEDQSKNGVRVIVSRTKDGSFVDASCKCFGSNMWTHSVSNCKNINKDKFHIEAAGVGAATWIQRRKTLEEAKHIADESVQKNGYIFAEIWELDDDGEVIDERPVYTTKK